MFKFVLYSIVAFNYCCFGQVKSTLVLLIQTLNSASDTRGWTYFNQFFLVFFVALYSWCHVPPIIPWEIFSYCENDTQCVLVSGSACNNSHQGLKCQCVPGLRYDLVTNECVTGIMKARLHEKEPNRKYWSIWESLYNLRLKIINV